MPFDKKFFVQAKFEALQEIINQNPSGRLSLVATTTDQIGGHSQLTPTIRRPILLSQTSESSQEDHRWLRALIPGPHPIPSLPVTHSSRTAVRYCVYLKAEYLFVYRISQKLSQLPTRLVHTNARWLTLINIYLLSTLVAMWQAAVEVDGWGEGGVALPPSIMYGCVTVTRHMSVFSFGAKIICCNKSILSGRPTEVWGRWSVWKWCNPWVGWNLLLKNIITLW